MYILEPFRNMTDPQHGGCLPAYAETRAGVALAVIAHFVPLPYHAG